MLDKDGKLPEIKKVLLSDAIGTSAGAMLGTSTITTFVESSSGIMEGGRTGLTSLVSGLMFILSLFFPPIFLAIPSFATAPALIYVGMLMLQSTTRINFSGDAADAAGAFMAIVMTPLTYSIANGIMFGIMTWVLIKTLEGRAREISPIMWVVFLLFALRIITLVTDFK